jgi:hypothetical protein
MTNKTLILDNLPIPHELIERRIYLIRGQKVMLDSDLAELYQVQTKNLNKAVSRNLNRFPGDFMFQLTETEAKSLRFQFGTSNTEGRGGRRTLPYAFTEHGVVMLSAVLNSNRAIQMNIIIVRAFIKMRQLLSLHKDLSNKVDRLERNQKSQEIILTSVIKDIKQIKNPPLTRAIGFRLRD